MAGAHARSAGGHPAKPGLLAALWAAVVHALPATLFLAAVVSALAHPEPRWLAASTGAMMRLVQATQDRREELDSDARANRMVQNFTGTRAVSVLEFTPEADSRFFLRTTPVPRQRLACVLDALAGHLATQREPGRRALPVVVVDFDISTARLPGGSTASTQWVRAPGEADCFPARPRRVNCRTLVTRAGAPPTIDDVMLCALAQLSAEAQVVLPVFPRATPADRSLRNALLRRVCDAAQSRRGGLSRVHLASAQAGLLSDVVFEYSGPLNTRNACGSATSCTNMTPLWPAEYPGMGNVAARLLTASAPETPGGSASTAAYCADLRADPAAEVFDDFLADSARPETATFYDSRRLEWLHVEKRIATVPLDVGGRPEDGLGLEAQRAFANVGPAAAYFIGVDSGTGQDRYRTPLQARSVAGAWIHGAIALSEAGRLDGESARGDGHDTWSAAKDYATHVLVDVIYGVVFVLLCTALVQLPLRRRYPALHGLLRVGGPAAVALALWMAFVFAKTSANGAGNWSNPLPLLVGLGVHMYLHAAEGEHDAGHGVDAATWSLPDQLLTLGLRWLWATSIAVAAMYGVTHGAPVGNATADTLLRLPDPLFAVVPLQLPALFWVGAALLGAGYVAAASWLQWLRWLPLAWRSP